VTTAGFLLRFVGGLVAGLAVAALALTFVAHGDTSARAAGVLAAGVGEGRWSSGDELAWLRRAGTIESALIRALAQKEAGASTGVAPSGDCRRQLRRLAPAPSRRLEQPLAALHEACARIADATTTADVRDAVGRVLRADAMLPPAEGRPLPVVAGRTTTSRIEPRFSRIASDLAGHPVEVRCWSTSDWPRLLREETAYTGGRIDAATLGFAGIDGNRENLSPGVCANLVALAYGTRRPQSVDREYLLAAAVVTLSHEPQHSRGIADEAQAECYAIQLSRSTAERLGAPPAYAASLQRVYWLHYAQELPAYRSGECRDGGAYDLDSRSPNFP
jgi:hypothetical protein